jgi:hypothetical protein
MSELGGIKHDGEKPDLSLFSPLWINGVAQVLTFGKRKYSAHNWRKGIQISRLMAACLRHIFAFIGGEDFDPETGLSHLDHASCCLMFARELIVIKRQQCDDRYRKEDDSLPGISGTSTWVPEEKKP